jgi:hypothetical protein
MSDDQNKKQQAEREIAIHNRETAIANAREAEFANEREARARAAENKIDTEIRARTVQPPIKK